MDIRTLLDNLYEEVSCSVCLNTFSDPKQLPCLHSFCLRCLKNILRTSGHHDIIKCPDCRRECEVPESGNLEKFPTNFRINSLLDVLAIKECDTSGVKCGNCEERSAQSSYCFHCCAFWCDECLSAHNIIRANKEHRVLALKDFEDQDISEVLKRSVFCPKSGHEKRELEFFCKICKAAICNACALIDHDGHAKTLLEEAANERRVELKSSIETEKERLQAMKRKITNFDEKVLKIQENAAYVERGVQQFADEMKSVIEAKKKEMIEEVKKQAKKSLQCLEVRMSENEREMKTTETALEMAETLLKQSPDAEIMRPNKVIDQILKQKLDEQVDELNGPASSSCESFLGYDFVKNQKFFESMNNENIGTFKYFPTMTRPRQSCVSGKGISEFCLGLDADFVVTTKNGNGEQCYEEADSLTVHREEASIFAREIEPIETQVQNNRDGTYKISYFSKNWSSRRVSVKINGEHVYGSPFTVEAKCREFRPVLSFGQQGSSEGMFNGPCGVAVNERDEIAVSDSGNHRVQVFSSNGTYLRSFGAVGDKQGEFHMPSGIAFDANENIVVGNSGNQFIQIFTREGKYLSHFFGHSGPDLCPPEPSGLSVDSDGNIIVPDYQKKLVKIFSPGGQLLHTIGSGHLTFPIHCIQNNNIFLVSDRGEHGIKMFDRKGKFLKKVGSKGVGNKQFNDPCCLSVDKAGQLMICDELNQRVQLLDIPSGKFRTKFEIKGKGIGGLGNPVSMAVLSNGRIVVSDSLHHCVHIYE